MAKRQIYVHCQACGGLTSNPLYPRIANKQWHICRRCGSSYKVRKRFEEYAKGNIPHDAIEAYRYSE